MLHNVLPVVIQVSPLDTASLASLTSSHKSHEIARFCAERKQAFAEFLTIQIIDIRFSAITSVELQLHERREAIVALRNALNRTTSLMVLYLNNNKIDNEGAITLASALHRNVSLKSLFLKGNQIGNEGASALASVLCENVSLTILDLSQNSIEDEGTIALAKSLHQNHSLKILAMDFNPFGDAGATAFATALHHNHTLTQLDVRQCNFGGEDEIGDSELQLSTAVFVNTTIEVFNQIPIKEMRGDSFTELSLHDNIGNVGAMLVYMVFPDMVSLTSIDMNKIVWNADNRGTIDQAVTLDLVAILKEKQMVSVGLSNCDIGPGGVHVVADYLSGSSSLTSLDLSRCGICISMTSGYTTNGISALASALMVNNSLRKLCVAYNDIDDEGAKIVAEAVGPHKTLTSLALYKNKIGSEGAIALANNLCINASLTELVIGGNLICGIDEKGVGAYTIDGINALTSSLVVNSSLRKLELGSNRIGDDGAHMIAHALRQNSSLKEVMLWENNIGDRGAILLADNLRIRASALEILLLSSNSVGDAGAVALAGVLRSLTELHLTNNKIGDSGAVQIAYALYDSHISCYLTKLDIRGNCIGDVGVSALALSLHYNNSLACLKLDSNRIRDVSSPMALAKALHTNTSLTELSFFQCHESLNDIERSVASQLSEAVLANTTIELFEEIPVKKMRADFFTKLTLDDHIFGWDTGRGLVGAMIIVGLVPFMGSLKKLAVPEQIKKHVGLRTICKSKGIELVQSEYARAKWTWP